MEIINPLKIHNKLTMEEYKNSEGLKIQNVSIKQAVGKKHGFLVVFLFSLFRLIFTAQMS